MEFHTLLSGSPPRRGGGFDDGGGSWRSGPRGGGEDRGPPRRGSPPRLVTKRNLLNVSLDFTTFYILENVHLSGIGGFILCILEKALQCQWKMLDMCLTRQMG